MDKIQGLDKFVEKLNDQINLDEDFMGDETGCVKLTLPVAGALVRRYLEKLKETSERADGICNLLKITIVVEKPPNCTFRADEIDDEISELFEQHINYELRQRIISIIDTGESPAPQVPTKELAKEAE